GCSRLHGYRQPDCGCALRHPGPTPAGRPPRSQGMSAATASLPSHFQRSRSNLRAFFKSWPPLVLISLGWLLAMMVIALCAQWLMPYEFSQMDLRARLQPPVLFGGEWAHILGTDELG